MIPVFLTAYVPISAAFLAIGFSAFFGIVFGIVPAAKAANLDLIDALRYEQTDFGAIFLPLSFTSIVTQ